MGVERMKQSIIVYFVQFVLALVLAPLLPGIINRVKAKFAGRHGKPILQTYYDLAKLMRKGEVISRTTTWVFACGPAVSLATTLCAIALLPLGGATSPLAFTGDFILAAYLLGMGRFAIMLSALDTGAAFEGMGASREATFSALAEPLFFLILLVLTSVRWIWDTARTRLFRFRPCSAGKSREPGLRAGPNCCFCPVFFSFCCWLKTAVFLWMIPIRIWN